MMLMLITHYIASRYKKIKSWSDVEAQSVRRLQNSLLPFKEVTSISM